MSNDGQLTPMMAQYRRIKGELPKDALLLFRLGDFYEMFFEDAQIGAQLLNVALTKRGVVPMCGIPFHAANTYVSRLLKAELKNAPLEKAAAEAKANGTSAALDAAKLQACVKAQDDKMVRASMNEGELLGLSATPTMYVNGMKIDGALPPADNAAPLGVLLDERLERDKRLDHQHAVLFQ